MSTQRSRTGVQSEAAEDHSAAGLQSTLTLSASPDTVLNRAISSGSDPNVNLVLKLARLVADEGHLASIINADNMRVQRCDLASAVLSGMLAVSCEARLPLAGDGTARHPAVDIQLTTMLSWSGWPS